MTRAPLAAFAFLGLTFCQAEMDETWSADDTDDASEHAVYYELCWSDDDTASDPPAWEVASDLGYGVRVARGFLNTQVTQLVPCKQASAWFGLPSAYAGHTSGTADPSAVETPMTEWIAGYGAREFGAAMASDAYCALYVEVGPAAETIDGVDLSGVTLYLELSVQSPGDSAWTERTIVGAGTYGRQVELPETLDIGSYSALVSIQRQLATTFDGVDFDSWSDDDIALRVINNLLSDATFDIYIDN